MSSPRPGGLAGLAEVIELSPCGLCAIAAPGLEILAANQAYLALAGIERDRLCGTGLDTHHGGLTGELIPICDRALAEVADQHAEVHLAGEKPRRFSVDVARQHRDGEPGALLLVTVHETTAARTQAERLKQISAELWAWLAAYPDLVFRLDADARILGFEAGPETELYMPPAAFIGRLAAEVLPDSITRPAGLLVREALATGSMQTTEYQLPISGRDESFEARFVPVRGEVVMIVRCVTAERHARDVARQARNELEARVRARSEELERANAALVAELNDRRASELRLGGRARLLDQLGHAVFATDRGGLITYWNRRAEELTGRSATEAIGRHVLAMTVPEERWGDAVRIIAAVRAGAPWSGEFVSQRQDGTKVPIVLSATPLVDEQGKIAGGVVVAADIQERARAEEGLKASEERYRQLAEATHDLVFIVGEDDRLVYVNRSTLARFGRKAEDVIGRPLTALMPEQIAEEQRQRFSEAREHGGPVSHEVTLETDAGGRYLRISLAPLHDRSGRVTGILGVGRDVTEGRRVEESLRLLADTSGMLAATQDVEAALDALARRALPMFGRAWIVVPCGEPPQRPHVGHVDSEHEAKLARALTGTSAEPAPWPELCRILRTGGARGPEELTPAARSGFDASKLGVALADVGIVHVALVPLRVGMRLLGGLVLGRDASAPPFDRRSLGLAEEVARRLALALDNARLVREARLANAAKDRLLAVVSHELRNLLEPVLAAAEALRRLAPATVERPIGIIEHNAKLGARLVGDLLDLSRYTQGKAELERRPLVLDSVVEASLQPLVGEAAQAGLKLEAQLEPGLCVEADADRLSQIVMNLVGNAIKFTPSGGRVRVLVQRGDDVALLIVEDTGIGFDRATGARMFGMFEQQEIGHRPRGLGIGLALVKSMAELHGGRVYAHSEGPGHGSRFTVELPLCHGAVPGPEMPRPAARTGRLVLLLVEDHADTRSLLADGLALLDYEVLQAGSGEEALVILGQGVEPDVLVIDLGLPGIDGYEVLRRARELHQLAEKPAVALTGWSDAEAVRRVREAGFAGHLVKPVGVAALDRSVREAVARAER